MLAAITRLEEILNKVPGSLLRYTEVQASSKPGPNKWSKKEIIGHLIDSASNNHQRFVRLQFETGLQLPDYEQDAWVAAQRYQELNWIDLVKFWMIYNKHLLHVLKNLDAGKLPNTEMIDGKSLTLQFMIEDYVRHMEHHLEAVTG